MGDILATVCKPPPAKLFLAIMYRDDTSKEKALEVFTKRFGDVDKEFGPLEVAAYTHYYDKKMGKGLKKCYMTFKKLIERHELCAIKIFTNEIENKLMKNGKRPVNLDPGYLNNDKLVLASTKDFFHRIYLDKGIYAEVTLHYRKGKYRFFSWTFPDYKEKEVQKFLEKARAQLVGESRK